MRDLHTSNAGELRRLLFQHFSDDGLRSLCQDLAVDYEQLPGQGKEAKARELIAFMEQRGRLADLLAAAARERPHVAWGAAPLGPVSDRAHPTPLGPVSDRAHPDVEIHTVAQIGNPVIRALRGVSARISRVLQIGGGRIEIGATESDKETPRP